MSTVRKRMDKAATHVASGDGGEHIYDIDGHGDDRHVPPVRNIIAAFPCSFCKRSKAYAYVNVLPIISRRLISHYALCLRGCANCLKLHGDTTRLDVKRTVVIMPDDICTLDKRARGVRRKYELITCFINQLIIMEMRARIDAIMEKLRSMENDCANNPAYLCRCELYSIYKKMFASGFGKTQRVEHACLPMNYITLTMFEGCAQTFAICADYTTTFANAIISIINAMGFQITRSKWAARSGQVIQFPVSFAKRDGALHIVINAPDNSYLLRSCL